MKLLICILDTIFDIPLVSYHSVLLLCMHDLMLSSGTPPCHSIFMLRRTRSGLVEADLGRWAVARWLDQGRPQVGSSRHKRLLGSLVAPLLCCSKAAVVAAERTLKGAKAHLFLPSASAHPRFYVMMRQSTRAWHSITHACSCSPPTPPENDSSMHHEENHLCAANSQASLQAWEMLWHPAHFHWCDFSTLLDRAGMSWAGISASMCDHCRHSKDVEVQPQDMRAKSGKQPCWKAIAREEGCVLMLL